MGRFEECGGASLPASPSPEDLRAMAEMESRTKPVVMLRPRLAPSPLPRGTSKMGGSPDVPPDFQWPQCPDCLVPLNFVLQLHQAAFPEFPFPAGADQFVLFRCPHTGCPAWIGSGAAARGPDRHFAWAYVASSEAYPRPQPPPPAEPPVPVSPRLVVWLRDHSLPLPGEEPEWDREPFDGPVPECRFDPLRTGDHPGGYEDSAEWWGATFLRFREQHSSEGPPHFSPVFEEFTKRVRPRVGSKIGGFADWKQGAAYPRCACGRRKDFIFQLSSEDRDPERERALNEQAERDQSGVRDYEGKGMAWPRYWSDHGIMVGDLGNVYFYACAACGPQTLETSHDCG